MKVRQTVSQFRKKIKLDGSLNLELGKKQKNQNGKQFFFKINFITLLATIYFYWFHFQKKNVFFYSFFYLQQKFLDEFNEIGKTAYSSFPLKITPMEMKKDFHYSIKKVDYIVTQFHEKTVVFRITDENDELRSFFLPDAYAQKVRKQFEDPDDFICYKMFLEIKGFRDEVNKKAPLIRIFYDGEAQLVD